MKYEMFEKLRNKNGYKNNYAFAKEFGKKFKFSQQILSYWENGKRTPRLETQIKIGKALKLKPEQCI